MKINNTVQDWVSCTVLKKPEFFFVPVVEDGNNHLTKPVGDSIFAFLHINYTRPDIFITFSIYFIDTLISFLFTIPNNSLHQM